MKLATLTLAAALLVPSLAAANPDMRAERRARILERFDANRDGQLDPQERAAAKAAKRAIRAHRMEKRARRLHRFIERFDRNHDGSLGPGEVPPRAAEKLRRLDRDGDGWVRPNEMRPRRDRMRDAAPPADTRSQAPGAYDDDGY